MKTSKWLAVNQRGAARLSTKPPTVGPGEVVVRIDLEVANELFYMPTVVITARVPKGLSPVEAEAEVLTQVEGALRFCGVKAIVSLAEPEDA